MCSPPSAGPARSTAPAIAEDFDETASAPVDPRIGLSTRQEFSDNQIVRVDFIGELAAADLAEWRIVEASAHRRRASPSAAVYVATVDAATVELEAVGIECLYGA